MKSRRKQEIKHDSGCYQNDWIFILKQRLGKIREGSKKDHDIRTTSSLMWNRS